MLRRPNKIEMPSEATVNHVQALKHDPGVLTDEMFALLRVPELYVAEAKKEWKLELARPHKKNKCVEMYCHASRHGDVYLIIELEDGEVDVGLSVEMPLEDNDDEDESLPDDAEEDTDFEVFASDVREWTNKEEIFLGEVWTRFDPVKQLKAEKKIMPNAKCPCGSGRKYKRCCQ